MQPRHPARCATFERFEETCAADDVQPGALEDAAWPDEGPDHDVAQTRLELPSSCRDDTLRLDYDEWEYASESDVTKHKDPSPPTAEHHVMNDDPILHSPPMPLRSMQRIIEERDEAWQANRMLAAELTEERLRSAQSAAAARELHELMHLQAQAAEEWKASATSARHHLQRMRRTRQAALNAASQGSSRHSADWRTRVDAGAPPTLEALRELLVGAQQMLNALKAQLPAAADARTADLPPAAEASVSKPHASSAAEMLPRTNSLTDAPLQAADTQAPTTVSASAPAVDAAVEPFAENETCSAQPVAAVPITICGAILPAAPVISFAAPPPDSNASPVLPQLTLPSESATTAASAEKSEPTQTAEGSAEKSEPPQKAESAAKGEGAGEARGNQARTQDPTYMVAEPRHVTRSAKKRNQRLLRIQRQTRAEMATPPSGMSLPSTVLITTTSTLGTRPPAATPAL